MTTFVAGPLSVGDAREYDAFNARITEELRTLMASGRLAEMDGVHAFLDVSERFRQGLLADLTRAEEAGLGTFDVRVPMTTAEHRTLFSMGTTLQTYLEILTMRGAIDSTPPAGASRCMAALGTGRLED
jgi:hypothetical protein